MVKIHVFVFVKNHFVFYLKTENIFVLFESKNMEIMVLFLIINDLNTKQYILPAFHNLKRVNPAGNFFQNI